jgi:3-oxoacyl-[acyl-carrier protein] reductase
MMDNDYFMLLAGKNAVITGGGRGIGESIALKFAQCGANIVIADINELNAKKVANDASSYGIRAMGLELDITSIKSIDTAIGFIEQNFGAIDIWVNNAGISKNTPIEEITESEWDLILDTDLKGAFLCSQAVLRVMKNQKHGKIINIASLAGQRGGRFAGAHYSAAKGGVIVMTKSFALSAGQYNINVNAIAPGLILTQMSEDLGWKNQDHSDIPLGRLGSTQDVANAALFLASSMSDYITGTVLMVNGGMYMG